MTNYAGRVLSILRIVAALLFIEHGTMKLFQFPAPMPFGDGSLPPLMLVAALLEVGLGTLLVLGWFTRIAAFICAGEMAVAYFIAHASKGFWPALNGGDAAILFCFIFLYLAAAGGGDWSIDRAQASRRAE